MKNLWQMLGEIMIALASIGLILGGLSLFLAEGNLTTELFPGAIVRISPMPTQTPVLCGLPGTWIAYAIWAGDALHHLSWVYGITVVEFRRASYLGHSALIRTGRRPCVSSWATRTPLPTLTNIS